MVPLVSRDEYFAMVGAGTSPVLAQMEAPWCGDCHHALPELEAITEKYAGQLTVLRLDGDKEPRLREDFHLQGFPTYIFVEHGQVTASCFGAPDFGLTRLVEILLP